MFGKVKRNSYRPVFLCSSICAHLAFYCFRRLPFPNHCSRLLFVTLYLIMIFIVSEWRCSHPNIEHISKTVITHPFRIDDILNWLFIIRFWFVATKKRKEKSCQSIPNDYTSDIWKVGMYGLCVGNMCVMSTRKKNSHRYAKWQTEKSTNGW